MAVPVHDRIDRDPIGDPVSGFESEFMCSCDDEGKAECAAIVERARTIVSRSTPCEDDLDFVNRMLYWLTLEGDLSIGSDQWAGVGMTPFKVKDPETLKHYTIQKSKSFQCDSIVDGLAALVVHYFENEEDEDADQS